MSAVIASGTLSKAICDRCKFRYHYRELRPDPNLPGLMVCDECRDQYDPYRLPARPPDAISLRRPRPDEPLGESQKYIVDENGELVAVTGGELAP